MERKLVRLLVMPAVYRFPLSDWNEGMEWGWHRATELLEAVNNNLEIQKSPQMRPEEIVKHFPQVSPYLKENNYWLTLMHIDERMVHLNGGEAIDWFTQAVSGDYYLPARIGTELIKAVRKLKINAVKVS